MSSPVRRRAGLSEAGRRQPRAGAPGGGSGRWRGPFGWGAGQTALAVVGLLIGLFLIFTLVVAASLPDPSKVAIHAGEVKILDRNQKLVATVAGGGEQRQEVPLGQVSPLLQNATVDAEDRNFYSHNGIDYGRLAKAITVDLVSRRTVSGASTITEQLAKLSLLTPQGGLPGRTLTRKYKEAILAAEIEQRFTKDKILELYLNTIYYGHRAYGAEAAAKVYFDKPAKDLTLGQASLLAGLPQAPSSYDPAVYYSDAKARQSYVLDQMVRAGHISAQQAADTKAEDLRPQLKFKESNATGVAPHFVGYIQRVLEKTYGTAIVSAGGVTVTSTLDLDVQNAAKAAVEAGAAKNDRYGANNAAMLVEDPNNGQVLAMVGSRDFNRADIAGQVCIPCPETKRQPGSSFKPYVYASGLADKKFNATTVFHDTSEQARSMDPKNPVSDFDNRYEGTMRLRTALVQSRNVPAEEAMQKAGPDAAVATAHRMGIGTEIKPFLASAIGASEVTMLDHAEAYGVFATGGYKHDPVFILKVLDSTGADVTQKPNDRQQVLDAGVAFIISDVLKNYNDEWHLGFDRVLAAKSGTTNIQDPNGGISTGDGWLMAYNQEVVIATWGGHTSTDPNAGGATKNFFGVYNGQNIIAPFLKSLPGRWKKGLLPKPADVTIGNCPSGGTQVPDTYAPPGGEYLLAGDSASQCPSPSPTTTPSAAPSASPSTAVSTPTPDTLPSILPTARASATPTARPSATPSPTPSASP